MPFHVILVIWIVSLLAFVAGICFKIHWGWLVLSATPSAVITTILFYCVYRWFQDPRC